MKKLVSLLVVLSMAFIMSFSAFAEQPEQNIKVSTKVLENGIVVVDTLTTTGMETRSGVSHSRTREYYSGSSRIASVTLSASFIYDGITAHATAASSSHWVASGWSYSGESVYTSGATAYLSATISGSTTIPVDITLTCDPYGNIY